MKMNTMCFVLIACGFVAGASAIQAQSFRDQIRVNDSGPGTLQAAPQITFGPDNRMHVVWNDFRSGRSEIVMASSTDGGLTFSPTRSLLPGRTALSLMQRGIQLVIDRRGGFHMVWQEQVVSGKVSAMYSHSLDGGQTFSTPIFAGADSGRYSQDFPSIAVDSNENVTITYIDNRELENGVSQNTQLYVTRSNDRGATFSTPKRAGTMPGGVGGSCECCNTAVATSRTGDVFISFRGNINNDRDIHIARSTDGGETFSVFKAASSSWRINACPMTGSAIAVDRNARAHVVWRDSRQAAGGKALVYYATLDRDATACTPDLMISDSPKVANFPTISITTAGDILVTWQDNRDDAMDVRYVRSADGGNSFAFSEELASETSPSRQELAATTIGPDDIRYAVWQDSRRDEGDILFARDTSTIEVVAPDKVTSVSPLNGATIGALEVVSWNAPANLATAYQVRYDVTVIDPRSDTTSVTGLVNRMLPIVGIPGTYRWAITARTLTGVSESDTYEFTVSGTSAVRQAVANQHAAVIQPMPVNAGSNAALCFQTERPARVTISIVDVAGRLVEQVLNAELDASSHSVMVGRGLESGFYHCIIASGASRSIVPLVVR